MVVGSLGYIYIYMTPDERNHQRRCGSTPNSTPMGPADQTRTPEAEMRLVGKDWCHKRQFSQGRTKRQTLTSSPIQSIWACIQHVLVLVSSWLVPPSVPRDSRAFRHARRSGSTAQPQKPSTLAAASGHRSNWQSFP